MVKLTPEAQKLVDSFINTGIEITAVNMINKGYTLEEASDITGLSKTQINKLCRPK